MSILACIGRARKGLCHGTCKVFLLSGGGGLSWRVVVGVGSLIATVCEMKWSCYIPLHNIADV